MKQKFSIGLDLGTNSIGWAVFNRDFSLVKKGNKNLWGVLLFDEASKADSRRIKRSARRRSERRKERIKLLQSLLKSEICAVDSDFFMRLKNSYIVNECIDKTYGRKYRYNLFNGRYTDKQFYHDFATIYHLRKWLCETNEKADIRLIYLAIHHIVKYRGNFLREENKIIVSGNGVLSKLNQLKENFSQLLDEYSVNFNENEIFDVLNEKNKTPSDKAKNIKRICGGNAFSDFIGKALCGLKASPSKAFSNEFDAFDDAKDISFAKDTFDDVLEENATILGEDITAFILSLYEVYNEIIFIDILGEGNDSISSSMINRYNNHHEDLKMLKEVLLPRTSIDFKRMFDTDYVEKDESGKRKTFKNSYGNYIHIKRDKSRFNDKTCSKEDFYSFCKDVLSRVDDNGEKGEIKAKILQKIELGIFMPKINDVTNGVIPYQIHLNELEKIIDNQSKYYTSLKENKDKIISLLTFRRPYYVGPLKGKFSWIGQQINQTIYPWNFSGLVNEDEAQQKFIEKLVEVDEYTNTSKLPLQSITYQKYIVLNELNNIRLNNKPLPVEIKQGIYNELVLEKSQVKNKEIVFYVNNKWLKCAISDFKFAGETKLLGSMKTYRDFINIFDKNFVESNVELCDEAVKYLTIFTDVKSKKRMLKKLFASKITNEQLEKLSKKSYSGWGKFSYEHLTDKYDESEQAKSILTLLYETDRNYNSIIFEESYGFKSKFIKQINKVEKFNYDSLISDLYSSPAVKKVTWQAVKLVKEIVKIIGNEPEFIFIESTRKEELKKRKDSRYKVLDELYTSVKNDTQYYNNEFKKQLIDLENEKRLDDERVYLYLRQMGRCMYTEQTLDINNLEMYEVDHIVPRCFIKDDSLDNKVLVIKEANQRKGGFTLSKDIIEKRYNFWNFLLKNKFISSKKFKNLTKTEWNESDVKGFINRQLTETSQINKTVENTLKSVLEKTEVYPIKSALVTQLRKMHTEMNPTNFGSFYKIRNLNDYHHAKDAYLVGVMGLFTKLNFPVWGNEEQAFNIKKVLEKGNIDSVKANELINKRYGIIVDYLMYGNYECANANGEPVDGNTAYNNILKTMDRNDVNVVIQKNFDGETNFYDETIYGKPEYSSKSSLVPRKSFKDQYGNVVELDPNFYGGYSSSKQAYYINVEYGSERKRKTELVGVYSLDAKRKQNGDDNAILNMLIRDGKENPIVVGKPVYKNQLINYNGQKVIIVSASEVKNATQLIIDKKYHKLLHCAEKGKIDFTKYVENDFISDCQKFFVEYFNKVQQFYPLYKNVLSKLQKYVEEKFYQSDIDVKLKFISSIISITKDGATNMSMFGLSGEVGRLKGKTIIKDDVEWINNSITGYYVDVIHKKVN